MYIEEIKLFSLWYCSFYLGQTFKKSNSAPKWHGFSLFRIMTTCSSELFYWNSCRQFSYCNSQIYTSVYRKWKLRAKLTFCAILRLPWPKMELLNFTWSWQKLSLIDISSECGNPDLGLLGCVITAWKYSFVHGSWNNSPRTASHISHSNVSQSLFRLRPATLGLWDSLNHFTIFTQPPYSFAPCQASGRLCMFT